MKKIKGSVLLITIFNMYYVMTSSSMNAVFGRDVRIKVLSDYVWLLPIPIFFIIIYCIYYLVDLIRNIGFKYEKHYRYTAVVVILFTLLSYSGIWYYESNEVKTGGIFRIQDKLILGNEYFFEINDKVIKCNRSEFNLINAGAAYAIQYHWNKLFPDIGNLRLIDPIGRDDNV